MISNAVPCLKQEGRRIYIYSYHSVTDTFFFLHAESLVMVHLYNERKQFHSCVFGNLYLSLSLSRFFIRHVIWADFFSLEIETTKPNQMALCIYGFLIFRNREPKRCVTLTMGTSKCWICWNPARAF